MSRFKKVTQQDLKELALHQNAKNTVRSTKFGVKLFESYLSECGITGNIEDMMPIELNDHLAPFYAAARKEDGELYKLNSMKSVRSSIQRHYLQKRNVDLIEDSQFASSNLVFSNILRRIKEAGKGDTEHYPEIEPEDVRKLYSSFDTANQHGLQEKVWFDTQLYLIRRGREGLRAMKKTTFGVFLDATGRKYFCQVTGERDKNHDINDSASDTNGEGRLYATGGAQCPVKSFEEYISHLHPNQDALWQRPLENIKEGAMIWYYNAPVGEKTLGGMLAKMSTKYQLSQRYTNHSIRVTSMQILEDNQVEGRHIQRVSGHKSLDSIQTYAKRLSTARKRDISDIFSKSVGNTPMPILPKQAENIGLSTIPNDVLQNSSAPIPNSATGIPPFQFEMAVHQNRIANLLNNPNFAPNFSLMSSFDNSTTTSTTNRATSQLQQPIYNMGTINIHNYYDSPKRKKLRVIYDSSDEE
jgi:hypothetical protein